jgi:hypothetical protein
MSEQENNSDRVTNSTTTRELTETDHGGAPASNSRARTSLEIVGAFGSGRRRWASVDVLADMDVRIYAAWRDVGSLGIDDLGVSGVDRCCEQGDLAVLDGNVIRAGESDSSISYRGRDEMDESKYPMSPAVTTRPFLITKS